MNDNYDDGNCIVESLGCPASCAHFPLMKRHEFMSSPTYLGTKITEQLNLLILR